ncbi:unnamed protein product [Clonostachys rosea]|uniref:ADF-H domain-containing protein n=1 Tax=Bionectria ochroleuca TaxID=29856 RepID=A0ABY6U702_BIOOC|nr:unnamed protein product [Clonostachys rosea]
MSTTVVETKEAPKEAPIFGNEDIHKAVGAIRKADNTESWVLLSYTGERSNKLGIFAEGQGLEELKKNLDDKEVLYGYQRIEYANDSESKRIKFVVIVWIGPEVKVMRRARVSVQKGDIVATLKPHGTVEADEKGDIVRKNIETQLRKNGGADYNGGRG